MTATTVAAVVVTYRRPEVLKKTLTAITQQTMNVDRVVVVDNAAAEGTSDAMSIVEQFPDSFEYLPASSNIGYGAALAIGMQYLRSAIEPDFYWLLDDDSPPTPASLANKVAGFARPGGRVGVVAGEGGHVRFGRIRHDLRTVAGAAIEADFTLVDGAVVSSLAVEQVGYPRRDLFMMLEDFEYTSRIASMGFVLLVQGDDETQRMHLGSSSPWRGYYQARNLLRIALDRRSLPLLVGCMLREIGFAASFVRTQNWTAATCRIRGLSAALKNEMGRTVVSGHEAPAA